jgi:hypothetical protein
MPPDLSTSIFDLISFLTKEMSKFMKNVHNESTSEPEDEFSLNLLLTKASSYCKLQQTWQLHKIMK